MSNGENKAIAPIGNNVLNEAARIGKAAKGGTRLIKFREGVFLLGKDDEIDPGRTFVAYCGDWRRGWRRWEDGQIVEDNVGCVREEISDPPKRDKLGDLDKTKWERSKHNGEASDPWVFENQVPFEDAVSGELFLFVTQTYGGLLGVEILCARWSREMIRTQGHCGLPTVKFGVGYFDTKSYKHKMRPDFQVVSWENRGGGNTGGGLIDITPSSGGAWDPADDDLLEIR